MILSVVLYIVACIVRVFGNINNVFWTVQRLPIIIGGNNTLLCDTASIKESKVTWMKKSDVIVHHGLVFYPLKYTEYSSIKGSFLNIMNTGVDDINVSYTCISDVFSFDAILKLNESNYIVLPNQKRTNITWSLKETIGVNVSFQHVYPMPKCELFHNEILLSTTNSTDSHMKDIFYKDASISLINNSNICGGNIKLRCTLLTLNMHVDRTNVLPACNEKYFEITTTSNTDSERLFPLYIAVSGFVTTCIVVAICLIRGTRKALLEPDHDENNQLQVLVNSSLL
ncbi:unnamed protein product [Mytilus coruscus]|uniref:Uncharacterized protein n=1 Tax=Mytilus coruscus TaxID=42192 RepID=A0A6J8CY43_MYTCO|nr:unnamed protein product [Mytilus coruscus]